MIRDEERILLRTIKDLTLKRLVSKLLHHSSKRIEKYHDLIISDYSDLHPISPRKNQTLQAKQYERQLTLQLH